MDERVAVLRKRPHGKIAGVEQGAVEETRLAMDLLAEREGCTRFATLGLCSGAEILGFVEDVGRHNAADAISGQMWLEGTPGHDKIFYTTGRLTSEIVMKVTQMGIPILLSRSGVTHMGLELAEITGVTMIARAKGKHFLVYSGADNVIYDAVPTKRPGDLRKR